MVYFKLEECPVSKKEIEIVAFFRHKGLYMCHAYYKDRTKRFNFYLTEKNEFLTKGQARKRLQKLFPNAVIQKFVVTSKFKKLLLKEGQIK